MKLEVKPQAPEEVETLDVRARAAGLQAVAQLAEELVEQVPLGLVCTGLVRLPTFLSTSRISGSGRAGPVEAEAPGAVTTVAAARRLANAQGPGDTDGDPRRTPDFSTAISSAITGDFQCWRLYTGVTS